MTKQFRRFLSAALACAMLAANLPAISRAEAPPQSEEVQTIQQKGVMETESVVGDTPAVLAASSGTCGENVTWTLDDSGTLTISGKGAMKAYERDRTILYNPPTNAPWYAYRNSIVSIVISTGVTYIGAYAFSDCSNLTTVTIPVDVSLIGYYAFAGCSSLSSVHYGGTDAQWDAINILDSNSYLTRAQRYDLADYSQRYICGVNTVAYYQSGTLTVVGPGAMTNYTSAASVPWYSIRSSITSVVIESRVSAIGDYAFAACTNLPHVIMPTSVTTIGSYAFAGCARLATVTIPANVSTIGSFAFYGCTRLTMVNYGGTWAQWNAVSIASGNDQLTGARIACTNYDTLLGYKYACGDDVNAYRKDGTLLITGTGDMEGFYYDKFIGPTGLTTNAPWWYYRDTITNVVIEDGVTSIGMLAFNQFSNLVSVTIPESVTAIGGEAFYDCDSLTDVTIPEGVTIIGGGAFSYCDNLTTVTVPGTVTTVRDDAFYRCDKLATVNYHGTEAQWNAIAIGEKNYRLTDAQRNYFPAYDQKFTCGANATAYLKDGILTIVGTGAMTDHTSYSSVPWYSVRDSITSVVIQSGVTSIGSRAFLRCSNLASVSIPGTVEAIGDSAFLGCSGLTTVTIPAGVTTIHQRAFENCSQLSGISIPASVTSIASGVFTGCTKLKTAGPSGSGCNIEIGWTDSIPAFAFNRYSNLTSVRIPDGVTSIGEGAFNGCAGLTGVTIPDSVTTIGAGAFNGCTGLTEVTIPGSITAISPDAFKGCTRLTNVVCSGTCGDDLTWTFANGTLTISGSSAMTNYSLDSAAPWSAVGRFITGVVIESGVASIGDLAFSGCTALTSITIPDSVGIIGEFAFSGCTGLTDITIPGSDVSIGTYAFYNCGNLTSLVLSGGVPSIGENAFEGCGSLTDIRCSGTCGNNLTWTSANGTLTISGTGAMWDYSWDDWSPWAFLRTTIRSVVIQPGITSIGGYAFRSFYGVTGVTIPSSVTTIGEFAFEECSGLTVVKYSGTQVQWKAITIGDGNDYLMDTAIAYNCAFVPANIQMILPSSLTTVAAEAFAGDTAMTSVKIPGTVTAIQSGAFKNSGLTVVVFDSNAPAIAADAFAGVTATVYYPESNTTWMDAVRRNYGGDLTWVAYTS